MQRWHKLAGNSGAKSNKLLESLWRLSRIYGRIQAFQKSLTAIFIFFASEISTYDSDSIEMEGKEVSDLTRDRILKIGRKSTHPYFIRHS